MQTRVFRFDTGALSHTGKVRSLNEDSYSVVQNGESWTVAIVADGMGGHSAGDVASRAIVAEVRSIGVPSSAPDLRARFEDRINRANEAILDLSRENDGVTIGATVAALLTYESRYACIWSGDSRVYLIRGNAISQVSRDHTEAQDLLDRGIISAAEAETWPRKNVITRAIGVTSPAPLEIAQGMIEPGDVFVVCSDGLTGHVSDDEIFRLVAQNSPQAACEALVDLTLERGALDNVTVIVVRCVAAGERTIVYD